MHGGDCIEQAVIHFARAVLPAKTQNMVGEAVVGTVMLGYGLVGSDCQIEDLFAVQPFIFVLCKITCVACISNVGPVTAYLRCHSWLSSWSKTHVAGNKCG